MARKDKKKSPLDIGGEIDESLALLTLALRLGDDLWVAQIKDQLTNLVEMKQVIETQQSL